MTNIGTHMDNVLSVGLTSVRKYFQRPIIFKKKQNQNQTLTQMNVCK